MKRPEKYIKALESDGFVMFQDFFDPNLVSKARDEISLLYDVDQRERESANCGTALHEGSAGKSILTKPTHLLLDVYGKSPILDLLFEKILTDPTSSAVLEALAGKHLKMRGYNIKKMTGSPDPKPTLGPAALPHEWHRDSPGEICIAIFLDDFSVPGNGTTALMKGTHTFPYCPRWNCLFGPHYLISLKPIRNGISTLLRFTIFNRLLARSLADRVTGAYGKRGDFYIFINDIWHGREPNIHGSAYMMLMAGAFPTERPFPDEVKLPAEAVVQALPPALRSVVSQSLPSNVPKESIIDKMLSLRGNAQPTGLQLYARFERRVAEFISEMWYSNFRK